ncbi:MAG: fused MFS/spermidine synthase [Actinomycetota bacterium]|nr:fused MFS/spermidine synthase [Actinomycetota bacterium]
MSPDTLQLARDLSLADGWLLYLGGTAQSHVDLDDPTHLEFEYARRLGHVVDLMAPEGVPLRALHLGGGALTLPRYLAVTRPGSPQHVVENNEDLVALVVERLPLWPNWPVQVEIADAREALERVPAGTVELLVSDVFAGPRIPAHLTSREFVAAVRRALAGGGTYAANIADSAPLAFARSQLATVRSGFEHVCVLVEPTVLDGRRFGNLVLVASSEPLPVDELARRAAADPFPARVLHGTTLDALVGDAAPIVDETAAPSPLPPPGSFGVPG